MLSRVSSWIKRSSFLFPLFRKQWKLLAFSLLLEIALSVLSAIIPYFTKLQVDLLESKLPLWPLNSFHPTIALLFLLLIPAGIELLRLLFFERVHSGLLRMIEHVITTDMRHKIWEKVQNFDYGFFLSRRSDHLRSNMYRLAYVPNRLVGFVNQRARGIASLLTIIPLLTLVSWELLVFISITSVIQYFLSMKLRAMDAQSTLIEQQNSYSVWGMEKSLEQFTQLQPTGGFSQVLDKYFAAALEEFRTIEKRYKKNQFINALQWLANEGLLIVANVFVGYSVFAGEMSLGTFTLTVSYTSQIRSIFGFLFTSITDWDDVVADLSQVEFFFKLKSRLTTNKVTRQTIVHAEKIQFKDVSFSYPDPHEDENAYLQFMIKRLEKLQARNPHGRVDIEMQRLKRDLETTTQFEEALQDIHFELQKGKVVALLGRNGAGKTTMTHLLMHHFEPTTGSILLNDAPIYEYEREVLTQQFGVLTQDPFLIDQFSIKQNITLGIRRKVTDLEIWELLEKLQLAQAIKLLPKGLDTVYGEDASLSGGQKQLVAIARVLLQQRPFVIFDEGTSQLDVEKEKAVLRLLKTYAQNAAVLFITHRVTSAKIADEIYMLDAGKIVEQGNHKELLEKQGLYSHFWQLQVVD